jgi:hypothetical protein
MSKGWSRIYCRLKMSGEIHQSRRPSSGQFAGKNLIHITPDPGLAGFNRADYGMLRFVKVLGGVFVLGRVATPDIAAHQAHPQMDPFVAHRRFFLL